jgi:hypothetical protein
MNTPPLEYEHMYFYTFTAHIIFRAFYIYVTFKVHTNYFLSLLVAEQAAQKYNIKNSSISKCS